MRLAPVCFTMKRDEMKNYIKSNNDRSLHYGREGFMRTFRGKMMCLLWRADGEMLVRVFDSIRNEASDGQLRICMLASRLMKMCIHI